MSKINLSARLNNVSEKLMWDYYVAFERQLMSACVAEMHIKLNVSSCLMHELYISNVGFHSSVCRVEENDIIYNFRNKIGRKFLFCSVFNNSRIQKNNNKYLFSYKNNCLGDSEFAEKVSYRVLLHRTYLERFALISKVWRGDKQDGVSVSSYFIAWSTVYGDSSGGVEWLYDWVFLKNSKYRTSLKLRKSNFLKQDLIFLLVLLRNLNIKMGWFLPKLMRKVSLPKVLLEEEAQMTEIDSLALSALSPELLIYIKKLVKFNESRALSSLLNTSEQGKEDFRKKNQSGSWIDFFSPILEAELRQWLVVESGEFTEEFFEEALEALHSYNSYGKTCGLNILGNNSLDVLEVLESIRDGLTETNNGDFFLDLDDVIHLSEQWGSVALLRKTWGNFFFNKQRNKFAESVESLFHGCTYWFFWGLSGFDRKNLFFRLFFYYFVKYRARFFKWMLNLALINKKVLPWDIESAYILRWIEIEQEFLIKKSLQALAVDRQKNLVRLFEVRKRFREDFDFFDIICGVLWEKRVQVFVEKRKELYPHFEDMLYTQNDYPIFYFWLVSLKILIHVYYRVFCDLFTNPVFNNISLGFFTSKLNWLVNNDKDKDIVLSSWTFGDVSRLEDKTLKRLRFIEKSTLLIKQEADPKLVGLLLPRNLRFVKARCNVVLSVFFGLTLKFVYRFVLTILILQCLNFFLKYYLTSIWWLRKTLVGNQYPIYSKFIRWNTGFFDVGTKKSFRIHMMNSNVNFFLKVFKVFEIYLSTFTIKSYICLLFNLVVYNIGCSVYKIIIKGQSFSWWFFFWFLHYGLIIQAYIFMWFVPSGLRVWSFRDNEKKLIREAYDIYQRARAIKNGEVQPSFPEWGWAFRFQTFKDNSSNPFVSGLGLRLKRIFLLYFLKLDKRLNFDLLFFPKFVYSFSWNQLVMNLLRGKWGSGLFLEVWRRVLRYVVICLCILLFFPLFFVMFIFYKCWLLVLFCFWNTCWLIWWLFLCLVCFPVIYISGFLKYVWNIFIYICIYLWNRSLKLLNFLTMSFKFLSFVCTSLFKFVVLKPVFCILYKLNLYKIIVNFSYLLRNYMIVIILEWYVSWLRFKIFILSIPNSLILILFCIRLVFVFSAFCVGLIMYSALSTMKFLFNFDLDTNEETESRRKIFKGSFLSLIKFRYIIREIFLYFRRDLAFIKSEHSGVRFALSFFLKFFIVVFSFFFFLFDRFGAFTINIVFPSANFYNKDYATDKPIYSFFEKFGSQFLKALVKPKVTFRGLFIFLCYCLFDIILYNLARIVSAVVLICLFFMNLVKELSLFFYEEFFFKTLYDKILRKYYVVNAIKAIVCIGSFCLRLFGLYSIKVCYIIFNFFKTFGKSKKIKFWFSLNFTKIFFYKVLMFLLVTRRGRYLVNWCERKALLGFFRKVLWDDVRELAVFVSFVYGFSTFYWSFVNQISLEIGEFGWWIAYNKYSKDYLKHISLFKETVLNQPLYLFVNSKKNLRLWFYDEVVTSNSKLHGYFLKLNRITEPLLFKRAYVVDSFSRLSSNSFFKNSHFFKHRVVKAKDWIVYMFTSYIGLSMLLETLLVRFNQPINTFFNLTDSQRSHKFFFLNRLNFVRDTLDEFFWASLVFGTDLRLTVDAFMFNLWGKVKTRYQGQLHYVRDFKSKWFLPVDLKRVRLFTYLIPKIRKVSSFFFKWAAFTLSIVFWILCAVMVLPFCFVILIILVLYLWLLFAGFFLNLLKTPIFWFFYISLYSFILFFWIISIFSLFYGF